MRLLLPDALRMGLSFALVLGAYQTVSSPEHPMACEKERDELLGEARHSARKSAWSYATLRISSSGTPSRFWGGRIGGLEEKAASSQ